MSQRRAIADQAMDLIPIMNLVAMLIPLMLVSAQFVEYSTVVTRLQPVSKAPVEPPTEPSEVDVVSVTVDERGFVLRVQPQGGGAPTRTEEVPCVTAGCLRPEDFDYAQLTRRLAGLRPDLGEKALMVLVPAAWVPYSVVVATMDAAREDSARVAATGVPAPLFPDVVIAPQGATP